MLHSQANPTVHGVAATRLQLHSGRRRFATRCELLSTPEHGFPLGAVADHVDCVWTDTPAGCIVAALWQCRGMQLPAPLRVEKDLIGTDIHLCTSVHNSEDNAGRNLTHSHWLDHAVEEATYTGELLADLLGQLLEQYQ